MNINLTFIWTFFPAVITVAKLSLGDDIGAPLCFQSGL